MKTFNLFILLITIIVLPINASNNTAPLASKRTKTTDKKSTINFSTSDKTNDFFNEIQTKRVESNADMYWYQFGPGMAGYCEEFWCHPTDVNTMFMSPDMYNSYGTWDNGESWHTIKDCDGTGNFMRRVQSITFSHQDPNFGLAIDVRGYLYESHDRGKTWNKTKELGGRHSEMSVDPKNDNNWYIGAGDFWNVKANHRSKSNTLGYVYKYAEYGHILKSTDKGKTWKKITTGLPSTLDVGKIIVNPRNSDIVIAATNSGLYRSTDQGESWSLSATGLPNNVPRDMTYFYDEASDEFVLYLLEQTFYEAAGQSVTSQGGVFFSNDSGESWTNMTGNLALNLNAITSYSTKDKYHNAIGYWFGISKTEAKTQYPNYPSNILPVYNRLIVNPLNKNEIYISGNVKHDKSFGVGDVWKTEDGGKTWNAVARTGLYWLQNKDAGYWNSRRTTLGTNTKFAHLQHEMDIREEIWGNRFLVSNIKGEVFICLDQQTMRSNNGGKTWEQVDDFETRNGSNAWVGRGASNLPGRFLLLETGKTDRQFFCSGEHGLWVSAPLENYPDKTAKAVKQIEGQINAGGAHSIASVAVNPKNPDEIYILMFRQSHSGQFRKSIDGGKTWFNVSKPVQWTGNESGDMLFQYNLTVDYEDTENIYFVMPENAISEVSSNNVPAGFKNFGVYRSINGGKNFTIENTGLPSNCSVHRLKMDPQNPSTLYAALNESKTGTLGGLYKTENKGTNWEKLTIPAVIKSVNNVFIDRNNKNIFISCGRYEGTTDEGGVWRSSDEGKTWEKIFYHSYIWQTETSPVNPNIITVNAAMPHEIKGGTLFNPGAYLSKDAGKTWQKINSNLGQPNTITDLKPDPVKEGVYWCALKGSGWARMFENDSLVTAIKDMENNIETIKLYPNPTENYCNVEVNVNMESKIQINIFDLQANQHLCHTSTTNNNTNIIKLDTHQLIEGIYIMNINIDDRSFIKKFVKM